MNPPPPTAHPAKDRGARRNAPRRVARLGQAGQPLLSVDMEPFVNLGEQFGISEWTKVIKLFTIGFVYSLFQFVSPFY